MRHAVRNGGKTHIIHQVSTISRITDLFYNVITATYTAVQYFIARMQSQSVRGFLANYNEVNLLVVDSVMNNKM